MTEFHKVIMDYASGEHNSANGYYVEKIPSKDIQESNWIEAQTYERNVQANAKDKFTPIGEPAWINLEKATAILLFHGEKAKQ